MPSYVQAVVTFFLPHKSFSSMTLWHSCILTTRVIKTTKTCTFRILQWINNPHKWCNNYLGSTSVIIALYFWLLIDWRTLTLYALHILPIICYIFTQKQKQGHSRRSGWSGFGRTTISQGKNTIPFYRKQVINESTRVIFGLVQHVILQYDR